jgi:hypothetical protein
MNTYRRTLNNPSNITKLVNPSPLPILWRMEKHFTWSGGRLSNNVPVCGSTYNANGNDEVTQPYDGEIFCVETDLNVSTIWRFPHNHATWDHEYYWPDPFGNVSRSDVWIVKLD